MFTLRGPLSEENAYMKLWKAINRYNKTLEREKQDSLASLIHKTFISEQSKFCLPLPKELLDVLDPDVSYARPATPALKDLQKLAEENLHPLIQQFFQSIGQHGSLSPLENRAELLNTSKKVNSIAYV